MGGNRKWGVRVSRRRAHRALRARGLAALSVPPTHQPSNHAPRQAVIEGQGVAVRPSPLPAFPLLLLLCFILLLHALRRPCKDEVGGVRPTGLLMEAIGLEGKTHLDRCFCGSSFSSSSCQVMKSGPLSLQPETDF